MKYLHNSFFFIFYFFIVFGSFNSNASWVNEIHNIKSDDDKRAEQAIKKITEDNEIDQKIINTLKNDEYISEAFQASILLKHPPLFSHILNYTRKNPTSMAVTTLLSLRKFDDKNELPLFINELSTRRWNNLKSTSKLNVLFAIDELDIKLSTNQMKINLHDSSDQVRIFTARLAGKQLIKDKGIVYAEIIKEALHSTPYQLRIEALYAVKTLEPTQKKQFSKNLNQCLSDTNESVKQLCAKIYSETQK